MRLLSLCSGYGGLDLAVEAVLGCETVAYAEFDDAAGSVFARHWPGVPNWRDLTSVDWHDKRRELMLAPHGCAEEVVPDVSPAVDVMTAGYP